MDAIVAESYVSRINPERTPAQTESDEIADRATRKKRKPASSYGAISGAPGADQRGAGGSALPEAEIRHSSHRRAGNEGGSDQPPSGGNHGPEDDEEGLKYGAQHVIKLFAPVSLCMLVVVATINSVNFYSMKDVYLLYTPFHELSSDTGTKVWDAVLNSMILMTCIILMTILLILLYKKRYYKVIHGWLMLSSFMLLFIFSYLYLAELLRAYNIPMDYLTSYMIMWNFGVAGMMSIHWQGPLRLQQAYLIFVAALMALVFIKYLPEVTTWVVLAVISIWDLIAVLSPRGPLRVLVETAQERNEQIFPALIYSSTVIYSLVASDNESSERAVRPPATTNRTSPSAEEAGFNPEWESASTERSRRRQVEVQANIDGSSSRPNEYRTVTAPQTQLHSEFEAEERGIKLGLGDFIFYSVLVGKASSYGDWNTTIACFVAILIGLCLTLLLLAISRKALPALPISIFFGLLFCFTTSVVVKPFTEHLSTRQAFI